VRRFANAVAAVAATAMSLGVAGATADSAGEARRLVADRYKVRPPVGVELEALAKPPTYTPFASQRIYFVMPDRYANGDPTNDRGGATGSTNGFNPADTGAYHGGDLNGLTGTCTDTSTGLARLADLGFTAVWVTPVVAQKAVQGDSAAYHGYWGVDFTRVDPHLGTNDDFATFVDCAHRLRLKVYLDVVVNHTADVIRLAGGSAFRDPGRVPYRDCKGRPFAAQRYAGGKRFPCLSARYQPTRPLVASQERSVKRPAWLNQVTRYHNRGDIDFSSCSPACFEQGDFFGLDDLFTEQPFVVSGLAQVYGDWIRRYKLDGFRVDTAKHVDRAFFRSWVPEVRAAARAAGVSDFEIFGEVFLTDALELSAFVRDRGIPNSIDFPLQDSLVRYAGGSVGARGIASRLADDDYFRGPDGIAPTPATFLGNHDVGRGALLIKQQTGASAAELEQRLRIGHALLFLLRGAPVVYYGDEVGMIGRGGDKAARQDMFPTKVAEWRTEERVGGPSIGTGSSFDVDTVRNNVASSIRELARLRERYPALATGPTAVRFAREGVLVVSRFDLEERREYLLAFNAGEDGAQLTVTTATPSSRWTQDIGSDVKLVKSDASGRVSFVVQALDAVLLRADSELPRPGAARATLHFGADRFTNLKVLTAEVAGRDPVSVTFAVRRPGAKTWARLGVDDGAPYRVFLDPRRYEGGERVSLVAVVRASDGSVSTSPVLAAWVRK
jgi:glycosidase